MPAVPIRLRFVISVTLVSISCVRAWSIRGTVSDPAGAPLPGAEVRLASRTLSTFTDAQGAFTLTGPAASLAPSAPAPRLAEGALDLGGWPYAEGLRATACAVSGRCRDLPMEADARGEARVRLATWLEDHPDGLTQLTVSGPASGRAFRLMALGGRLTQAATGVQGAPAARTAAAPAFDTLRVALAGYSAANLPVDSTGRYAVTLSPLGDSVRAPVYMTSFVRMKIRKPAAIDFKALLARPGFTVPAPFDASLLERLNRWSLGVVARNPFAGLAEDEVPWINLGSGSKAGKYAFLTQRQMAFLFLCTLFAPGNATPDGGIDGLSRILAFKGDPDYYPYVVTHLLARLMDEPLAASAYVGIAFGGMDQAEGMDTATALNLFSKPMGSLNACFFDAGEPGVRDPAAPLAPEYCRGETPFKDAAAAQAIRKDTADLGGSFMAADIPGQSVVDIAGSCYGGGSAAPGVQIHNSQDESLPAFYPETLAWSFFNPGAEGADAKLCHDKGIVFLGVRRYLHGLNGSSRLLGPTAGMLLGPARAMLTQTYEASVGGAKIRLYDHSMAFVAAQLNGVIGAQGDYHVRDRRLYTVLTFPQNRWGLLNERNGRWSSPLIDVGKWYGCFAPRAYPPPARDALAKGIRRIGTYNWGAGVWWGDPQQYYAIAWMGTSLLENVALDYWIFSTSNENAGVQCALLKGAAMDRCNELNRTGMAPGANLPLAPPLKDYVDAHAALKGKSVGQALQAAKAASEGPGRYFFDGL